MTSSTICLIVELLNVMLAWNRSAAKLCVSPKYHVKVNTRDAALRADGSFIARSDCLAVLGHWRAHVLA
jgi:hypothetical protein